MILSRPRLFENIPRTAAPNGLCVDHWIACHLRHTFNYGWRLCVLTPFTRCTGTTWHFAGNKRFLNGLVSVCLKYYAKRKRDFTSITLLLWAGPSARIYCKRRRWIRYIFLIIYFRTSPRCPQRLFVTRPIFDSKAKVVATVSNTRVILKSFDSRRNETDLNLADGFYYFLRIVCTDVIRVLTI